MREFIRSRGLVLMVLLTAGLGGGAFAAGEIVEMDGRPASGKGFRSLRTKNLRSPGYLKTVHAFKSLVMLSELDPQRVLALEAENAKGRKLTVGAMNPAGQPIVVGFETATAGSWINTDDGGSLWVLKLYAPEAHGQRVKFSKFSLSPGIEVALYNPADPTESLGPYTEDGPHKSGSFLASQIFSDTLVIECHVPAGAASPKVEIEIEGVIHYFKAISQKLYRDCYRDPTCYTDYKNAQSGIMLLDMGGALCTGNLINNNGPETYYVLTANHCLSTQAAAQGTDFYYFWETSVCNGPPPGLPPLGSYTVLPFTSGSDLMVTAPDGPAGPDVTLLRAIGAPPSGTHYLGWTTSDPGPNDGMAAISHPDGDYKVINFGSIISPLVIDRYYHWMRWTRGGTSQGSSGSALLNSSKKITGQLSGGDPITDCYGEIDYYGKFSEDYVFLQPFLNPLTDDAYEENDTQLESVLLPTGSYNLRLLDDDWFSVRLDPGVEVVATATVALDFLPTQTLTSPEMQIVDANGVVIAQPFIDVIRTEGTGVNLTYFHDVVITTTNTTNLAMMVYIRIFDPNGITSPLDYLAYRFQLRIGSDIPPFDDLWEDNDTQDFAARITISPIAYHPHMGDEHDWYLVDQPPFSTLQVDLTTDDPNRPDLQHPDIELELVDAQGSRLAGSFNIGNTESVTHVNNTGNTVPIYIHALSFDRNYIPPGIRYNLLVTQISDCENRFGCFVERQYRDILKRPPDPGGRAFYVNNLCSATQTPRDVVAGFMGSPEFANSAGFVARAYFGIFNNNSQLNYQDPNYRLPDFVGYDFWMDVMRIYGGDTFAAKLAVIAGIAMSPEWRQRVGALDDPNYILFLYENILGRPADPNGFSYHLSALRNGLVTRDELIVFFLDSPEAIEKYDEMSKVVTCYLALLARAAEPGGFVYYTDRLLSGEIDNETIIDRFILSPEYITRLYNLGCIAPFF